MTLPDKGGCGFSNTRSTGPRPGNVPGWRLAAPVLLRCVNTVTDLQEKFEIFRDMIRQVWVKTVE